MKMKLSDITGFAKAARAAGMKPIRTSRPDERMQNILSGDGDGWDLPDPPAGMEYRTAHGITYLVAVGAPTSARVLTLSDCSSAPAAIRALGEIPWPESWTDHGIGSAAYEPPAPVERTTRIEDDRKVRLTWTAIVALSMLVYAGLALGALYWLVVTFKP